MKWRTVRTILGKELRDTLRDKRTLIMMIGVPVLLYPAMLLVGLQSALLQHARLEATVSRVAIQAEDGGLIASWLDEMPKVDLLEPENPDQALSERELDAIVVAKGNVPELLAGDCTVPIEIRFDGTEFASRDAAGRLANELENVSERLQIERLDRAGLADDFVLPLDVKREDVAPPAKTTGTVLGLILPVIMIVMIALGAFYPAVDLTAGEKERGTFETLLATPTSKLEIVTGKFLTVFLLAMATGFLNLASMGVTLAFAFSQFAATIGGQLPIEIEVPVAAFFIILLAIIPLGFVLSALMMSIAVFARSFKEAQNYITPFFMIITLPAVVAGFPGSELGPINQFIPIANVVLLFRELLTGKAGFEAVFAVLLSTTVFALLSLLFAAWLFQREEVVLSEERGIPLSFRRADFVPRRALTPGAALGLFAGVLVIIFYAGSLAQQRDFIKGLLFTEWGLILLPVLLLLCYARTDWRYALNLRTLSPAGLTGAILLAPSALILILQVSSWHNAVLPMPQQYEEAFRELFSGGDTTGGLVLLLFTAAFSPAICEEALFRGALLTGLRTRLGLWASVLTVGLLFGLFHLSVYRIVATGLLGALLTYAVLRTGSISAGVLMHFLVNTLAILLATDKVPTAVTSLLQLETVAQTGVPKPLLAAASLVFLLGIALVEAAHWKRRSA